MKSPQTSLPYRSMYHEGTMASVGTNDEIGFLGDFGRGHSWFAVTTYIYIYILYNYIIIFINTLIQFTVLHAYSTCMCVHTYNKYIHTYTVYM